MSLEKASIVWSAKQLKGMVMNGKINFDHIIQRGFVWEVSRKSALIESAIVGYPIPPVFAKRIHGDTDKRGNNVFFVMDGKQRLSAIKEYLNDEFALTDLMPVTYMDDEVGEERTVDISNKKFSELPDALQNHLETTTLNVIYFDNLTKFEERELFKRLNQGKPLSAKSRMLASCKDIEGVLDIGSHRLFSEMMTEKARNNKNQVAVVMKVWNMMFQNIDKVSFESKVFNPLIEKTEITEVEKLTMIEVFNLIVGTHSVLIERKEKKVAKKLYTETHMVSLIPFFKKAVEDGAGEEYLADWLMNFFGTKDTASISDEYNAACTDASAKNASIVARNDVLSESYAEFFKFDPVEFDDDEESEEEVEDVECVEDFEEDESDEEDGLSYSEEYDNLVSALMSGEKYIDED